jgi:hypothetical protein
MERDEDRIKAIKWWKSLSYEERKRIAHNESKQTSVSHFFKSIMLITRAYRKHLLKSLKKPIK